MSVRVGSQGVSRETTLVMTSHGIRLCPQRPHGTLGVRDSTRAKFYNPAAHISLFVGTVPVAASRASTNSSDNPNQDLAPLSANTLFEDSEVLLAISVHSARRASCSNSFLRSRCALLPCR